MSIVSDQRSTDDLPLWFWHLIRLAVLTIVGGGLITVLVLLSGAADPPHAGPLSNQIVLPEVTIPAGQTLLLDKEIDLPDPPFTLEVVAQFTATSDPLAAWGIQITTANPTLSHLELWVDADGYFSMAPLVLDVTAFIHIGSVGKVNLVYLDVTRGGSAMLRFNDESAWQGQLPALRSIRIMATSGPGNQLAHLVIQRISIFSHK